MKRTITFLSALALGTTLAVPLMAQQNTPVDQRPQYGPEDRPVPLPVPQDVVEGEAYFLERIAIPRDSKLFVTLVGRVAGAEYLPLASTITQARSGSTRFRLLVPQGLAPTGPYRLQVWVVANNRLIMQGANPQTTINSLSDKARIRLRMARAPQNIDGIGDGQPLQTTPPVRITDDTVRGTVTKRDRRALSPEAQIEVTVSDISLADAPAKVVARQTFASEGKQVPLPFSIPINAAELQANRRYTLGVRITEVGKLTYITNTIIPITPENWRTDFQVNVVPAGAG